MALSPDDRFVFAGTARGPHPAVAGRDRTVDLPAFARGLDVHPAGRLVALAGSGGVARLLDRQTGEIRELRGHRELIWGVRFTAGGETLVTSSYDGTVRVWDVATGRPRWFTTALLSDPVELLTHRGWEGEAGDRAPRGWHAALESRASLAAQSSDAETLCLGARGGGLELWDLGADRRLWSAEGPEIEQLLSWSGGCLVRAAGGRVLLYDSNGDHRALPLEGVTALWASEGEVLVAARGQLRVLDAELRPGERWRTGAGVTAVVRAGEALAALWTSYATGGDPGGSVDWPVFDPDGDVHLVIDRDIRTDTGAARERCALWDRPSAP